MLLQKEKHKSYKRSVFINNLIFTTVCFLLFLLLVLVKTSEGKDLQLTWNFNAPSDNVINYTIWYGPIADPTLYTATVPSTVNLVTISIPIGIEYRFGVR